MPGAEGQYGDLGKRFVARLIDGLLIGIPLGIVLSILGVGSFLQSFLTSLAALGYYGYMEGNMGATVGKNVMKLKVTAEGGMSMDKALRRNAFLAIGLVSGMPIIGFFAGLASLAAVIYIAVTISGDPKNQGIHDKFAGTSVVTV